MDDDTFNDLFSFLSQKEECNDNSKDNTERNETIKQGEYYEKGIKETKDEIASSKKTPEKDAEVQGKGDQHRK